MQDEDADKQTQEGNYLGQNKHSKILATQNEEDTNRNTQDDRLSADQGEKAVAGATSSNGVDDSESDGGADARKQRAVSPGTLALMCDEQDSLFMASAPSSGIPSSRGPYNQHSTQIYAARESCVDEFRDYLRELVTVGNWRATHYSDAVKAEPLVAGSLQINPPTVVAPRVTRPVPLVPDVLTVASCPVSTEPVSTITAFKACLPGRPLENGDIQLPVDTKQK